MSAPANYGISWSIGERILEIAITGEVIDAATADAIQGEVLALAQRLCPSAAIIDIRALKGRLGMTDAFYRVRSYPENIPSVPVALVDLQENAKFTAFYAVTACNAGHWTAGFTDMAKAREWVRVTIAGANP